MHRDPSCVTRQDWKRGILKGQTTTEHIRQHLLREAACPTYEELRETEWSPEFDWLMRSRLIMGVYRGYGRFGDPNKPQYDRLARLAKELMGYIQDGNTERLVEIATHAMLEFVEGKHPRKHYHAAESDGSNVTKYRKE
jgi:hypothetical protein